MRIIGGSAKGRKLISPPRRHRGIRPTSDRARESLFQILGPPAAGARVLDLFAGTGSLGLEALSRGAGRVIFVDADPTSLTIISRNLHTCFSFAADALRRGDITLLKRDIVRRPDFFKGPRWREKFDLVFLDPPYKKNLAKKTLVMVEESDIVKNTGRVIAEEHSGEELPQQLGTLRLLTSRRYGETGFWIYTNDTDTDIRPCCRQAAGRHLSGDLRPHHQRSREHHQARTAPF